jgi:uncharacterized protein YxjI
MGLPDLPDGWSRFKVKSKFGAGRDFAVLDWTTEEQRFLVDGKIGARPKAEVQDASGKVVYKIRGSMLGIPKHITITDAAGTEIASLRAKAFSIIKDKMTLSLASGGSWELEGSFREKDYKVSAGGQRVAQITQKWVTIRDTYTLDVSPGTDPGLALALLWAVDRWTERD